MAQRPDNDILAASNIPTWMWLAAEKQALRSNLSNFRTGCAVYDRRGRILSTGCSHASERSSRWTHAGEHACGRMRPALSKLDAHCVVVTVTKGGGWAWSSRPCARCANTLYQYNIAKVSYAERCNDGTWEVATLVLEDVIANVRSCDLNSRYARGMRFAV